MYKALDVADYVVHHALETGQPIIHLQLQKILYYLEASWLTTYDASLFEDEIEMWKLGPVVPEVYHQYKIFGSYQITFIPPVKFVHEGDSIQLQLVKFDPEMIKKETRDEIDPLVDRLLEFDGFTLVEMTHQHDLWAKHAKRIQAGEKVKVKKEDIRDYFLEYPDQLMTM